MNAHPLERVPRTPRTCVWSITSTCNLRCLHCINHGGQKGDRELSVERMSQILDELVELGCKTIEVTGGEPLMHPSWDILCAQAIQRGLNVAIITNGTLLSQDNLQRAKQARVSVIAVSIDGLQAVHDRTRLRILSGFSPWEETIAGVMRAKRDFTVKVITQVNKHNLSQLPWLRLLLRDIGVRYWQVQLALPAGRLLEYDEPYVLDPKDLEPLTRFLTQAIEDGQTPYVDVSDTIGYYTQREPSLRKRATGQGLWLGCQAGIRLVAINSQGKVQGCSVLPPEFDAGDLHHESLKAIWQDAKRFAYTTAFDPRKLNGKCAACQFGALCRAGCTALAYWTTGTVYANTHCLTQLQEGM